MPKSKRNGKRRGRSGGKTLGRARGSLGYDQVIKVTGSVSITASTGGNTFVEISGYGAGTGTNLTPYANGTNYATLSQWGDFRLSKVVVRPVATVVGSTADSVNVVAAMDETGGDYAGGTATGAWNAIRSRQTARTCYLSNARPQGPKWSFKPKEFQSRDWVCQTWLSAPGGLTWGVLVSSMSATSSTVTLEIDWYFNVREPTLSGVLLGKEEPELRARLERQTRAQCPWLKSGL